MLVELLAVTFLIIMVVLSSWCLSAFVVVGALSMLWLCGHGGFGIIHGGISELGFYCVFFICLVGLMKVKILLLQVCHGSFLGNVSS